MIAEGRQRMTAELAAELAEAPRFKRAPAQRADLEPEQAQPLDREAAARAWREDHGMGGRRRGRGR